MRRPGPTRRRPTLSLCMIVRDEERSLPGCLASVKGVVDEIVVVDTGSTDATCTLLTGAGAVLHTFAWTGDFSAARNAALDRCTGDWILYLDADERLAGGQEVMLAAMLRDRDAAAYTVLVRSDISLKTGTAVEVMRYPRVFRRDPAIRFEGAIHEQIRPSILRRGGRILPSSLVIHHDGYSRGYDVLKTKVERNLAPLYVQTEQDPGNWYPHLQIARSLMLLQEYEQAASHVAQAFHGTGIPRESAALLHNLAAEIHLRSGQYNKATDECRQSLHLVARQFGARWMLAGALMHQGSMQEALPLLEELATVSEAALATGSQLSGDMVLSREMVLDQLVRGLMHAERYTQAHPAILELVRMAPTPERVGRLIQVLEHCAQPDEAIVECGELALVMPQEPRLPLYVALSFRRKGDRLRALGSLRSVLAIDPRNAAAHSWLVQWLLEWNEADQADDALAEALTAGVMTKELHHCALQRALARNDVAGAQEHLRHCTDLFPEKDLAIVRQRLEQLAATAPGSGMP